MSKQLPSADLTKHLQSLPPNKKTIEDRIRDNDLELARKLVRRQINHYSETGDTLLCCDRDSQDKLIIDYLDSCFWALILEKTGFKDVAPGVLDEIDKAYKAPEGTILLPCANDGCIYSHPILCWALAAKNPKIIDALKRTGMYSPEGLLYRSTTDHKYSVQTNLMLAIVEERLGIKNETVEKIKQRPEYSDGFIKHTSTINGQTTANIGAADNCLLTIALSAKFPNEARTLVEKIKIIPMFNSDGHIKDNLFSEDSSKYTLQNHALWSMALRCTAMDSEKEIDLIRRCLSWEYTQFSTFSLSEQGLAIIALAGQTL